MMENARFSPRIGHIDGMRHYAAFWTLLMFALWGCSEATHPPAEFSKRLPTADRVVVTNRFSALGSTITGAEVSNLAKAAKSATRKTWGANMNWTDPNVWDAEFYAGTNELAVIPIVHGVFKLKDVEYSDGTGVVEAFWKKLEEGRMR
jgi:hypothetical protein